MTSLVNHSITNLINGVSQQATSVRLDNQLEEQINCFSDVTKGLTIRNGFELQNVVEADLSERNNIEFTIDDVKYMIAINADDATPAIHIPMTADVQALATTITDLDYFKNTSSDDLRIVENKDFVYILNKNKVVGTNNLKQAFYDIKVTNLLTGLTDDSWSSGDYTLTIEGVGDPDTSTTATESSDFVIDHNLEPYEVAALINADTALVAETGECYAQGSRGNYRLTFDSIPDNYVAPAVSVVESTAIQGSLSVITLEPAASGSFYNTDTFHIYFDTETNQFDYNISFTSSFYTYVWNGVEVGSEPQFSASKSLKVGNTTYFRGNFDSVNNRYSIRRETPSTVTADYTPSVVEPDTVSGAEYTVNKFADEAMIWVTGVAANQEYNVRIEYKDAATNTPQTPVTATASVGSTASNIKLNWVADTLSTTIHASPHFSTVVKDNAIHIYSTSQYAYVITNIEVDNNFDTSSISGVIKATLDNENAITDSSDLPPVFIDGFKVRIGGENDDTNYYLRYDSLFQGWKECGLDESRILDSATMPYIIDKNKVRREGSITIEPAAWERATAGDSESNPYPSFIDKTINDIFFYGSRLGVATDDSIILSAVDKPAMFFRTTCSKTLTSERVDIKLDSSKTGFNSIKNVVTYDGKLFLNTGAVQSVLLVNTAFDLSTARLSEVSSYTLGDRKPLPVENGLYFALYNNGYSNIISFEATGNNTYQAINTTRHVPTYIEGRVKKMEYADYCTVVSVEENKQVLYIQNRYTENGQVLQNAWHKWTTPYDIEHFYFEDNNLYVLMTAVDSEDTTYTLVTKYNLTPQVVTETTSDAYIGWIPYLDCWTKDKTLIENFPEFIGIDDKYGHRYDSVAEAYTSTEVNQTTIGVESEEFFDEVAPEYYWEIDGNTINLVWNGVDVITVGNSTQVEVTYDGYRYFRGELSDTADRYGISRATATPEQYYVDDIVYGVPFQLTITLSEVIPRQQTGDGFIVMNYAQLLLRRMRLFLSKSGVFDVVINFSDRDDYTVRYSGQPLGIMILGRASVSDINFPFPINGKSNSVEITISSDSSTPFNLLSAEWQAQLTIRGRNI